MGKELNLFEQQVETVSAKKARKASKPRQPDLFDEGLRPPTSPSPNPRPSKPPSQKSEPVQTTTKPAPPATSSQEEGDMVGMLNRLREKAEEQQVRKEKWGFVKRVIEALLFASQDPLTFKKMREVIDTIHPYRPREIHAMLDELKGEYRQQDRAFQLEEVGNGYILQTNPSYGHYINLLYRNKRLEKLSQAATEVLAIIAYRQPITRPQMEAVRGVDCSGILQSLLERNLVECVGRLEAPGRPSLFAVTPEFFKYFGIKSLDELPQVGGLERNEG